MNNSLKKSRLRNFLGSQFHNAWPEIFGTWEEAVNSYYNRKTVDTLTTIRKELKPLIAANHDEVTLRKIVTSDLSANFYAPGSGLTYQQWLEKVDTMAAEWIKKKGKEQR